ncbi:DgyrCDS2939 [Dimorphilus gyrociliatus]|uniref:DgyrCDS2939 n=1 Tax=Dimorphilus gyrociliatus TaxID=2664684 RepID=A0A7I8VGT6_9ANNE|nr:DgyrCDS2939 [Dimorphilus gyrociliatus]
MNVCLHDGDNWRNVGHNCYTYDLSMTQYTWNEAKSCCETNNMTLVRITNTDENSEIFDMIAELETNGIVHGHWLGVYTTNQTFYDNNILVKVLNLEIKELYHDLNEPEVGCTALKYDASGGIKENWISVDCSSGNGVVCQVKSDLINFAPSNLNCLQTTTAIQTTPAPACPTGWSKVGDKCYAVDTSNEGYTWNENKLCCENFNAHPVRITSEDENSVLHALTYLGKYRTAGKTQGHWLGIQTKDGNVSYDTNQTITKINGQHIKYMFYDNVVPNNGCVILKFDTGEPSSENWKGVDCVESNGVVCETSIENSQSSQTNFSCEILKTTTNAMTTIQTTESVILCPDGWVTFGNYCYGIDQSQTGYTWSEAWDCCQSYNSTLLRISSSSLNAIIADYIVDKKNGTMTNGYWLGVKYFDFILKNRYDDKKPIIIDKDYIPLNEMYHDDSEPNQGCTLLMFIQDQKEIENWMSVNCSHLNGVICQKIQLPLKSSYSNFSCAKTQSTLEDTTIITTASPSLAEYNDIRYQDEDNIIIDNQNVSYLNDMYYDKLIPKSGCTLLKFNKTGLIENWMSNGCDSLNGVICQQSNSFSFNKSENLSCFSNDLVTTHSNRITTLIASTSQPINCPKSWISHDKKCFGRYTLNVGFTWQEAKLCCESINTTLVRIENLRENLAVHSLTYNQVENSIENGFWLGAIMKNNTLLYDNKSHIFVQEVNDIKDMYISDNISSDGCLLLKGGEYEKSYVFIDYFEELSGINNKYNWYVRINCAKGYHISLNNTISTLIQPCDESLKTVWKEPFCRQIICNQSNLRNINNSFKLSKRANSVQYICLSGYHFEKGVTVMNATCSTKGLWLYPYSSCKPIPCPKLEIISHSKLSCIERKIGRKTCWIRCKPNFRLLRKDRVFKSESMQIECLRGIWISQYDVSCQEILCPLIPFWENLELSSKARAVGSIITYSCLQSYSFRTNVSSYNIACLSDGNWNDTLNVCQETVVNNKKIEVEEAKHAEKYGLLSGLILATMIIFIAVVDIATIRWNRACHC